MFKNSKPNTPSDALSVIRSLQRTDGPLVFLASDFEADPKWTIFIEKAGEQEFVGFRPIATLLEIDLDSEVQRVVNVTGWDTIRVDVYFPASLRPSMAKLGVKGPAGDYLIMSFKVEATLVTLQ
jgi:hypothetical protein